MKRCSHGFAAQLCVLPSCEHWDGARSTREIVTPSMRRPKGHAEPITTPGMARCVACLQVKPFSEYYVHRKAKTGRQSRCKTCDNSTRSQRFARSGA